MSTTLLEPEAETVTPVASPCEVIDKLSLYHWTPAQYRQLAEVGILAEGEKVEFIEGVIVLKMIRNAPHDGTLQVVLGGSSRSSLKSGRSTAIGHHHERQ